MDSVDIGDLTIEQTAPEIYDWNLIFRLLGDLLATSKGCISSTALRKKLESNRVTADARPIIAELQFFDPESSTERGIPTPDFKFHHLGRSFYSEEKYNEEIKKHENTTKKEAEEASREASEEVLDAPPEAIVSRINRQEEARLVAYVKSALEDLYLSDDNSKDRSYVFDVHSLRKGNSFENVDLIAIHWRPQNLCELITVEVKLGFTPQVVQQALNYTRFSHRVWIAVPVATGANSELREKNTTLFEYAISHGLGILACRRRQGKSYEVFPIHWPLRNRPDPLEQGEFQERYRDTFEDAGVLESSEKKRLPRLSW